MQCHSYTLRQRDRMSSTGFYYDRNLHPFMLYRMHLSPSLTQSVSISFYVDVVYFLLCFLYYFYMSFPEGGHCPRTDREEGIVQDGFSELAGKKMYWSLGTGEEKDYRPNSLNLWLMWISVPAVEMLTVLIFP